MMKEGTTLSFLNDDEECQGQFDGFAAAAMLSSRVRGGGEKRKAGDGGNPKKPCIYAAIENSEEVLLR